MLFLVIWPVLLVVYQAISLPRFLVVLFVDTHTYITSGVISDISGNSLVYSRGDDSSPWYCMCMGLVKQNCSIVNNVLRGVYLSKYQGGMSMKAVW